MASSAHAQIRETIASGCTEEEFKKMRCPRCGAPLVLCVHPRLRTFWVRCEWDTSHMSMTEESQSQTGPEWWKKYVLEIGWC